MHLFFSLFLLMFGQQTPEVPKVEVPQVQAPEKPSWIHLPGRKKPKPPEPAPAEKPLPPGMERADWVIHARYIITMDQHHSVIEQGAIALQGRRIAAVGKKEDIDKHYVPKQTLEKPDAVLTPGFIDTHTHAPMSLLRGLAEDKKLDDWLTNYIFPAEAKNVSPEFVRVGTRLACVEMVLAGITTYTDMYFFEDVEAEAAKEVGVRGVLGQTIIGFPAPDYRTWQEAIASTERFMQRFERDELITATVAPHAIYTTPDEALVAAHNLAVRYNAPLLIHLAEMQKERDESLTKRNLTPTQVLEKLGLLDGKVVAAHSIYLEDSDLEILKQHHTGVAHCPSSNTKMAAGIARVAEMLKLGIDVGLGNDGFAGSNDSADLIREMDLAAKLQKVTRMDPTVLPAEQVFQMATLGGARVIGLDREIGSLEEGKRADIVAISLKTPDASPLAANLYSQIVHAGKAGHVEDVFINGKQIVADRKVLTVDADEVMRKADEFRQKIAASLKN